MWRTAATPACGIFFSSELKLRFGLPEFPILYTASATARAKAGYGFKEASALQQVQNCEKPMLFIHGTADDFIPYEMMGTLYNAKPGTNKATLTAEGRRPRRGDGCSG